MARHLSVALLSVCTVLSASAMADDETDKRIAAAALREARDIVARELWGHYDLTDLRLLKVEDLRGRPSLGRDYGLLNATLAFSARRNATKHANLNQEMFEPGSAMCQGWLYLHCGVPVGHVLDGTLAVLLAVDRDGAWMAVSPHWRSRRQYSLDGYLLLDGRRKEGYVLPPDR